MIDKIEQMVLGVILSYAENQEILISDLKSEYFSLQSHQLVFKCIQRLYDKGSKIDLITVTSELTKSEINKIGGLHYVSSLSSVSSNIHSDEHVRIIKQEYIRRNLIKLFTTEIRKLTEREHDVLNTQIDITKGLDELFSIPTDEMHNVFDVMRDRLDVYSNASQQENEIIGLKTGHSMLNKVTNGWQAGDLIILAARPSMGKTAISLLFAKFQAIQRKKILYFSLEMAKERLIDRILSLDIGINSLSLQNGKIEDYHWDQLDTNVYKYKDVEFMINDESSLSVEQIRSYCLKELTKGKIDMIFIDYLQLIRPPSGNQSTNDKVGHISRNLKGLAKRCNCPVMALSQLSREVEKRSGDKRPMLSDLRDSGNIEQDADIVGFLHRPEYYGIVEDSDGNNLVNMIDFIVAKNRNGCLGSTPFFKSDDWSYIGELPIEEYSSYDIPFNEVEF